MIVAPHPLFDQPLIKSFLQAFEHSMMTFVITSAETDAVPYRFLYVNERFKQQTGYDEPDLKDQSPKILQGPKTSPEVLAELKRKLRRQETFIGQAVNYRKDGSEYIVRWSINPILDERQQVVAYISCQMEVNERVQDQEQAFFLAEAINQTADAALITDLKGRIVYANRAFTLLTGYELEEIKGRNTRMFKSGKMPPDFYQRMWETLLMNQSFKGIFLNRHKDGHAFFEQKTITPIVDEYNQPIYFLAISKDSSEVIEKTHHLEYKAYHDALTGLFNRSKFDELMVAKLRHFEHEGAVFSLILGDLDDFKPLNDTYGHDVGDEVLKQLASVFRHSLRKDDVVIRWGGEEFCVLIDSDLKSTEFVAQLLKDRIAEIDLEALPDIRLTMSFGVAQAQSGDDPETLFKRADEAVYAAKKAGKNRVRIQPESSEGSDPGSD
ncbi:sensor domain-containing diguanylate cyclase [Hydrogenovibrio halophilus]|uniref:sensor domain-containing diguanylate cyclase n=1 Tax=Hydrogenovibrio halophilus TaxID=373391 RepID=UPI0003A08682|nr:diguanylate cyclase [Hydrogenovibrio halophilus]